jgi:hypothetical protein
VEAGAQSHITAVSRPTYREAWDLASGQLRSEMPRAQFETWVQSLKPLGYADHVFRLGAVNPFNQEWVEARLKNRITSLLSGMLNEPVTLHIVVINAFAGDGKPARGLEPPAASPDAAVPAVGSAHGLAVPDGVAHPPARPVGTGSAVDTSPNAEPGIAGPSQPETPDPSEEEILPAAEASPNELAGEGKSSPRKLMLQRAYGSERARVIQPERGMFVTLYFFHNWLPLLGHSAFTVILAARSMCYWNPKTGELRNTIDTEMAELAEAGCISVRTVKDVLNHPMVRQHFLRYTVRRVFTANGVRTAGITLLVRMDDPLTPEDQAAAGHDETGAWYPAAFDDEREP